MRRFFGSLGVKIFVGCWIVALLLPATRQRLAFAWHYPLAKFWGNPNSLLNNYTSEDAEDWHVTAKRAADEIRRQFPGDTTAQAFALERESRAPNQLGDYLALAKNNSDQAWLSALALRFGTTGSLRIPQIDDKTKTPPPDGILDAPPWLSDQERAQLVDLARRRGQIEPQNSFWPWMEAAFSFSLGHDEAALQALKRAAECSKFDDYTADYARRKVAFESRTQNLAWQQRMMIVWSTVLPHLAPMFLTVNRATALGIAADARGDKQRAQKIWSDTLRASSLVRQTAPFYISRLTGSNLQSLVWKNVTSSLGHKVLQASQAFDFEPRVANEFARLMETRGDFALAQYSRKEAQEIEKMRFPTRPDGFDDAMIGPLGLLPSIRLIQAQRFAASLAFLSLGAAILWLTLQAIVWFFARNQTSEINTTSAAWSVGATWAVLAVLAWTARDIFGYQLSAYLEFLEQAGPFLLVAAILLPNLLGAFFTRSPKPEPKQPSVFNWRALAWKVLLGIVLVSLAMTVLSLTIWDGFDQPLGFLWPAQILVFLGSSVFVWLLAILGTKGPLRLAVFCWLAAFLLSMGGMSTLDNGDYASYPLLCWSAAPIFGMVGLFLARDKIALQFPTFHPFWLHLLHRLRATMAALAVCSIALSLLISLAIWPWQIRAEKSVDLLVEKGEIAWRAERVK